MAPLKRLGAAQPELNGEIIPHKTLLVLGLTVGMLLTPRVSSWAAESDAFAFFQEESKVVTASRREQSIREIPMAIDVITADEIKASGATNLWDLMRFRVGMDVVEGRSIDGQRALVAIRGFPQDYVHNIQVLLDGRSVYEPIDAGAYWEELPVQMEDIDRIEIIRGPNAALYGSGAALGVINIITRRLQGPTQVALKASGGNLHAVQSYEGFESSAKAWNYRLSHTAHYQDGFPLADGSGRGNDYARGQKGNIRTDWSWSEGSRLELFTGGSWTASGLQAEPLGRKDYAQDFEMVKWSQKLGEHSTVELLASRNNYIQKNNPAVAVPTGTIQALQYDTEILHRIAWGRDRLNTTYGVNFRNVYTNSVYYFGEARPRERLWNGYMNQSIRWSDKLSLTGGVSIEHCNIGSGGTQTNYQVAPLWTPLADHSFRASYSVAHTVPVLFATDAHQPLPDNGFFDKNPDLKPQKVVSYEVGYRGVAAQKRLHMNTSLYYAVLHNIDTFSLSFEDPAYAYVISFDNREQAIARGVESEMKYYFDGHRSVYLNHTYEHVSDWRGDLQGEVTRNTPEHKVNFGGIAALGRGFTGTLNVGYKDHYFIASTGRTATVVVPAYWRLDARLAYVWPWYKNAELFVAGQNLAASTHLEFADGLTVPRTYQGGLSLTFGGS